MKTRIALCTDSITPYRRPLYKLLADTPEWDLCVFFNEIKDKTRYWDVDGLGFKSRKTFGVSFVRTYTQSNGLVYTEKRTLQIPIGLPASLAAFRPHVIISNEMGARSILAAAYKYLTRTPLIVWSGSTLYSERSIPSFKKIVRNRFAKIPDAWLAYSPAAKEYLNTLQVDGKLIHICFNSVDNSFFMKYSENKSIDLTELKTSLKLNDFVFLFVGYLIKRKGVDKLINAWSKLSRNTRLKASLLIVGSGPEENRLKQICKDNELGEVVFEPYAQQKDLPKYYYLANAMVFCTLEDIWGLVVNEAMCCDLPVLSSIYAGCSSDLIKDGATGILFDPNNIDETKEKIEGIINGKYDLAKIAREAKKHVRSFSIENMAKTIRCAVSSLLKGR